MLSQIIDAIRFLIAFIYNFIRVIQQPERNVQKDAGLILEEKKANIKAQKNKARITQDEAQEQPKTTEVDEAQEQPKNKARINQDEAQEQPKNKARITQDEAQEQPKTTEVDDKTLIQNDLVLIFILGIGVLVFWDILKDHQVKIEKLTDEVRQLKQINNKYVYIQKENPTKLGLFDFDVEVWLNLGLSIMIITLIYVLLKPQPKHQPKQARTQIEDTHDTHIIKNDVVSVIVLTTYFVVGYGIIKYFGWYCECQKITKLQEELAEKNIKIKQLEENLNYKENPTKLGLFDFDVEVWLNLGLGIIIFALVLLLLHAYTKQEQGKTKDLFQDINKVQPETTWVAKSVGLTASSNLSDEQFRKSMEALKEKNLLLEKHREELLKHREELLKELGINAPEENPATEIKDKFLSDSEKFDEFFSLLKKAVLEDDILFHVSGLSILIVFITGISLIAFVDFQQKKAQATNATKNSGIIRTYLVFFLMALGTILSLLYQILLYVI